ncbi:MAG: diguanylate cyclase [Candidatus Omnitrophota bacterium]|nr:diguanylate cyclase [Candidatus Omnitrophota bacterium]MBU1928531.1 diguanylate cyclase [Candidatus Omnitrophota bacterium]MBU2034696.1 diguanylate cyclase [Candidatus Omnitrophota bacterium]
MSEELSKIKYDLERGMQELERTKVELSILYEISNAMRTTLKLDEILYIILTGVTAHMGLGFNRAMLFLVNEKDGIIEGKMGIGPESHEEANRVWWSIEQQKMDMDDLINTYTISQHSQVSGFNRQVQHLKISIHDKKDSLLNLVATDGMPLHLTRETIHNYAQDPVIQILKTDELVIVPLKAKDKVNGIIFADNFITRKPITKDNQRMLIMLANQAGLAIENSQLYEKTATRANIDSLTDLWNHGYFQYLLSMQVEKSKATSTPLTLVLLDIDDFKIYNDSLGHQTGDKILKELALILKNQSRKMDYVCRYGGEEFAIILPKTDKKEAFLIAERLRENIEKHHLGHQEILPNKLITVSLGLSTFPEDGNTSTELISHSDKMLYEAKHAGKNKTCS